MFDRDYTFSRSPDNVSSTSGSIDYINSIGSDIMIPDESAQGRISTQESPNLGVRKSEGSVSHITHILLELQNIRKDLQVCMCGCSRCV